MFSPRLFLTLFERVSTTSICGNTWPAVPPPAIKAKVRAQLGLVAGGEHGAFSFVTPAYVLEDQKVSTKRPSSNPTSGLADVLVAPATPRQAGFREHPEVTEQELLAQGTL